MPNVLEVVIAHVVNVEDEAVLVLGDRLADGGKELVLLIACLLGHLRRVDDAITFGLGHLGLSFPLWADGGRGELGEAPRWIFRLRNWDRCR